ncbi:MAG TPA: hypothetical protein VL997_03395 [Dyella sp.]|nr:hypothetical protein [Dyella sp.]
MDFTVERHCYLSLHGKELETLRHIVRVAHQHLMETPRTVMRGIPLERRAGLIGGELFDVMRMLEEIGDKLGLPISFEDPSHDDAPSSKTANLPALLCVGIFTNEAAAPNAHTEAE